MQSFVFENPTRLIFGAGQIKMLREEAGRLGKRVLLVYGGGSIKRNGIYDDVMQALGAAGVQAEELAGVDPNPRLSTVRLGADICRQKHIDWVLAVGGGSVIDCAKAIAAAAVDPGDFWDIVTRKRPLRGALPIGTVLTHAATASEMNGTSVISNEETLEKLAWGSLHAYPKFSILDPNYTVSVPKDQTVYGIVDMMAHVFEQYFHHDDETPVQDGFCESILRAVVQTAPELAEDLGNAALRETILYCGTMGLNGIIGMGVAGDWANHEIEHAVSAVYDIPHGGGLAILYPHWMDLAAQRHPERFAQLAVRVFGVNPDGKSMQEVALEGIAELREFWRSLGAPTRLSEYGIDASRIGEMADKAARNGPLGNYISLSRDDIAEIYRKAL